MKNIVIAMAALAVTLLMVSCGTLATSAGEVGSVEPVAPVWTVVQDRVIEVTYEDFDLGVAAQYMSKYDLKKAGCSAVRVLLDGKVYVGRDYDFYCSDSPAFIVRNNSGKYRTIGVGNSPASLPAWTENYTVDEKVLAVLPAICCDVMSEVGIYAETNIRPAEEQFYCIETNPGKERRCTQLFMQTMLSQYGTLDEITQHLDDYDWYDLTAMGFQQSFFLTDSTGRSIIVEFAANECRWQEAEYNANFYQNSEWYALETLGCGEQRLARELAYKPFVRSEEDIFTMMKFGAYDQFYHNDVDMDYAAPEFAGDIGYDKYSIAADPEGARTAAAAFIATLADYTWQERVDNHTWESTFITAANVTDKELNVHFSEHYGIEFKVSFN